VLRGDCRAVLPTLPDASVHACVTSPPYYGLRDYNTGTWDGGDPACDHKPAARFRSGNTTLEQGADYAAMAYGVYRDVCGKCGAKRIDRQIGLEATPEEWLATMVQVFREVKRVLRPDGVCWVNMGDSYNSNPSGPNPGGLHTNHADAGVLQLQAGRGAGLGKVKTTSLKPKDLMMMPARLAIALQADGWWLRSMLPWLKRSAMPESTRDRPASAVEYVFMFSKSSRYFYDSEAVKRTQSNGTLDRFGDGNAPRKQAVKQGGTQRQCDTWVDPVGVLSGGRNMRNSDLFYDSLEDAPEPAPEPRLMKRFRGTDYIRSGVATEAAVPRVDKPAPEPLGLICDADGSPLALDVNPAPMKRAHFATFPPKLITPLIRASTSEKGCCAECGAPWVRQTEKRDTGRKQKMPDGMATHAGDHGSIHRDGREAGAPGQPVMASVTTGWAPGCTHEAAVVPCTVLDPFGGSGTVGLVCDRLQRDALLIDLNGDYAAMSVERVTEDLPLFADVAVETPESAQIEMFETPLA
jgi:DNA modification methylase